ncbi:MAG: CopD family protein [Arenimonas sp.]
MHGYILLLHLLGASIWTGGHLLLALTVLPKALRTRSVEEVARFESLFERIGVPALAVQVLTGLWLAHAALPDISLWFDPDVPVARPIMVKLVLLASTLALAADARLRVIPRLSADTLKGLAWHIIAVTLIAVLFVATGVSFRTGWLY